MAAAAALFSLGLAGCGDGSENLSVDGFLQRANAEGAGLVVGTELASAAGGRTFAVGVRGAPAVDHGGGGSVAAYEDARAAGREYRNCLQSSRASGALYCYRVENILLILSGDVPPRNVAPVRRAVARIREG